MKKVCFFVLFIASSAWGTDWKLLKEEDNSDFFYSKASIKPVNVSLYGLDPSYGDSLQMDVMENYYVRKRENDRSDYFRSVVRTNIFFCDSAKPEPYTDYYEIILVYMQFRDHMGKGDKTLTSVYNGKKSDFHNYYHTGRFALPHDVYERAWKIVCNKK